MRRDPVFLVRHALRHEQDPRPGGIQGLEAHRFVFGRQEAVFDPSHLEARPGPLHFVLASLGDARLRAEECDRDAAAAAAAQISGKRSVPLTLCSSGSPSSRAAIAMPTPSANTNGARASRLA